MNVTLEIGTHNQVAIIPSGLEALSRQIYRPALMLPRTGYGSTVVAIVVLP